MTVYCTRADLEARFGPNPVSQAAWRDGLGADTVIDSAASAAGDVIDGYLAGGGYDLPLAEVPPLIRDLALDIAWYKLCPGIIPDEIASRYRDAVKSLEAIQSGRLVLNAAAGTTVAPDTTDTEVLFEEADKVFDKSAWSAW